MRYSQAVAQTANAAGHPRRGLSTPYLLLAVMAAGCGVVGFWTLFGRGVAAKEDILAHRVERHSFAVTLQEKGELTAANSTEVKCELEGRSTIIFLMPEGTMVKGGDELVRLASNQIEDQIRQEELKETSAKTSVKTAQSDLDIQKDQNSSDIAQAQLKVDVAEIELTKYIEGDWPLAEKDADVTIEEARMALARSKETFEASKDLFDRKYITSTEYRQDEFELSKSEWALDKAVRAKELLVKYTHEVDLKSKKSALEEAQSERERVRKNAKAAEEGKQAALDGRQKELELTQKKLAQLLKQQEKCRIVAPGPGLVVYSATSSGRFMSSEDQVKEGAEVFERQTLMTIVDTTRMNVLLRVHESKMNLLKTELPARVQVEGQPNQSFQGHVSKIGTLAESQNRWLNPDLKEYEVRIELDETPTLLKPGVTAVAEIMVNQVEGAVAVPVQSVFGKGGKSFVFSTDGRKVEPAAVRVGASNTEWVQILDGISEGGQVLLAVNDDQLRMLPEAPAGAGRGENGGMGGERPGGPGMTGPPSATSGKSGRGGGPGSGAGRSGGGPPGQPGSGAPQQSGGRPAEGGQQRPAGAPSREGQPASGAGGSSPQGAGGEKPRPSSG